MNKKPVLVVMAAGMGSRYGGLKQIDPVGNHGQAIIDYSIYDAKRAGFETVVFVIKHEIEDTFKEAIGSRLSNHIEVKYAFQEITDLPEGYSVPEGRVKPWGTAHAIMAARKVVDGPFAVINADDYYGPEGFKAIYKYLSETPDQPDCYEFAMVGYNLRSTITENGSVSRGVCEEDENNYLVRVTERTCIEKDGNDARYSEDGGNSWIPLSGDTIVSLNLWGLTRSFIDEAVSRFPAFLDKTMEENPMKGEFFLPSVISQLIVEGKARAKVLRSSDKWHGVTYQADKPVVVAAIAEKTASGLYPDNLWAEKKTPSAAEETLDEVLDAFDFGNPVVGAMRFGYGHINDTFCVHTQPKDDPCKCFILQRMSAAAFKRPDQLMENIIGVTEYLGTKIKAAGGDRGREALEILRPKNGQDYYVDSKGGSWRVYPFIENIHCHQSAETPALFEASAVAFGKFQKMLDGYPAETLHETIVNFHNTEDRLAKLKNAIAQDINGRVAECADEIAFVMAREADCSVALQAQRDGILPLRVTHNDTKLNNVLIDKKTGEAICVIDLDTTMPGLAINDFGDSIRFGANHSAEDEKDLSKVNFDIDLYEAYTRGFLKGADGILTKAELDYLPWGAKLMTLECGIRFLTDYLEGDTYFRTHYPEQNLDRCRTQFKLVKDMEEQFQAMSDVVKKYC